MAKYLLLKHYPGRPEAVEQRPDGPVDPQEIRDHMQYMADFATRLEGSGEYVDGQALSPEGTFVRYDGEGRPPITDGPFAETKDLIAGWMVIDVDGHERRLSWRVSCRPLPAQAASRSTSGSRCARFLAPRRPSPSDGRTAVDVCAVVSADFLRMQRDLGNDLSTPRPEYGFPGLRPGDRWCVVAVRWLQAYQAGAAAGVVLAATNARALDIVPMEALRQHAVDVPDDISGLE